MIAISGKRDVLVSIFLGQMSIAENGHWVDDLRELPPSEVSAVYLKDDKNQFIPELLVVDTPNLQEFFAWCSTYLPHWSPLSAGIRVIERRRLRGTTDLVRRKVPRQLLRGLLCAALGELFFEWQLANGEQLLNVLSLRSTFGYAATCALIADQTCLSDLLSRWTRAQHLLQLAPRRLSANALKGIWAPIFKLANSTQELDERSVLLAEFANTFAGKRHHQQTLFSQQRGPASSPRRREHVVVELERYVRNTKLVDAAECLEAAAIASQMSTSPMTHFDVVSDMINAEPRTLLWYSFLSGMFASEAASPLIESLLFRVECDLRDRPITKPDIALEELEALTGPQGHIPAGIGVGARFINVELDSGVCASFRMRHETSQPHLQASEVDDKQLFNDALGQLSAIYERSQLAKESYKGRSASKNSRRRGKP
ncbi:MAG: hypothetical protein JNL18_06165 [Planctomycetaceae bacterium]|jgi:hypothetical protein|nr:hypothetical protein [Planctomycetaceae bacterium]